MIQDLYMCEPKVQHGRSGANVALSGLPPRLRNRKFQLCLGLVTQALYMGGPAVRHVRSGAKVVVPGLPPWLKTMTLNPV